MLDLLSKEAASDRFDPYYIWLGIPPQKQPPHHYCLLGIELFESSPAVIENAADQRMSHLRQYQTGPHGPQSQQLLNAVAAAKLCLLRPEKKAAYDHQLQGDLQIAESQPKSGRESVTPDGRDGLETIIDGYRTASRRLQLAGKRRCARQIMATNLLGLGVIGLLCVVLWHQWPRAGTAVLASKTQGRSVQATGRHPIPKAAQMPSPATSPRPMVPSLKNDAKPRLDPATTPVPRNTGGPSGAATTERGPRQCPSQLGDPSMFDRLLKQPQRKTSPASTSASLSRSSAAASNTRTRLAIPSRDAQEQVVKELDEVYRLVPSASAARRLRLAQEFLELSKRPAVKPAEQFVLLRRTAELAGEAGDLPRMLEAVDLLAGRFELDALTVKKSLLERFLGKAVEAGHVGPWARGARQVIDQAIAAKAYGPAGELAELAAAACQGAQFRDVRRQLQDRLVRVRQLEQQQAQIRQAEATLQKNPQDGPSNLLLGRWYCFQEGDWEKGLRCLAQGNDEGLRTLAKQELTLRPSAPEQQLKLADAWWQAAQARPKNDKEPMMLRAGYWYERYGPQEAIGMVKSRMEKRLKEIANIRRLAGGASSGQPATSDGNARGLWTDVF